MSRLQVGDDDHPEAAGKHVLDAEALLAEQRLDGAAYLSGYVIECSLKTLILHDKSYDSALASHDVDTLRDWHRRLRNKPYRHDTVKLLAENVGAAGAKYHPGQSALSSASTQWTPEWRYRAAGRIAVCDAQRLHADALRLYAIVIMEMRKDGLL